MALNLEILYPWLVGTPETTIPCFVPLVVPAGIEYVWAGNAVPLFDPAEYDLTIT